ncbi:MAG: apolipoprotein N-acyltransferase, partial [Pseudomonadota bacterium]
MSGFRRSLLAALAGGVLTLAQAPVGAWPALVLGGAALLWLIGQAPTPRAGAWTGWAAGTGYFATGLFWIVEPFFVDAARHGWMAPFALVFMAGGLALFWAVAGWAARRVAPGPGFWGALGFAVTLTLVEYARAHVLTGFPWALLAYGWIGAAPAQVLALIG